MTQAAWDNLGNIAFLALALLLFVLIIWAGEKRNKAEDEAEKNDHGPYPDEDR